MGCNVQITIKFDNKIVERIIKMAEKTLKHDSTISLEKSLILSKEKFSIHNERFKDQDHPHGFHIMISKKKLLDDKEPFIIFEVSCHYDPEHGKETLRDLTKWIKNILPTAEIVNGYISRNGGNYRYENGKWVSEGKSFAGKTIKEEIDIG